MFWVFPCCFSFPGDLMAAGVTFQLPHGRDVGSQAQGRRPQNRTFMAGTPQLCMSSTLPSFFLWLFSLLPCAPCSTQCRFLGNHSAAETYKTINVPAVYVATQAVSSLFASRRMTAYVMDIHESTIKLRTSVNTCRKSCLRRSMYSPCTRRSRPIEYT